MSAAKSGGALDRGKAVPHFASLMRATSTVLNACDTLGERVLLIEDDSRLAGMVSEYLGKAGFHVIHAENGTRGLALRGREAVDVVILDRCCRTPTDWKSVGRSARAPTVRS